MSFRSATWVALVLLSALRAAADPVVLRMATVAPDGTSWAREVRAFERQVASETNGRLNVKFYFGGVAGDELEEIDRIKRGQLDGAALSVTCARLAPSLRITRVAGLFQRPEEVHYVLNRLLPALDEEYRKSGFIGLSHGLFGSDIIFSREPVRTFDDLKKLRFWVWNIDEVWLDELPRLGLKIAPGALVEAARMYEQGHTDGFLAVPTAALALQWSAQAKYFTPLHIGFMPACLVLADRAFQALPIEERNALRAAAAKLATRFEDINLSMESQLLDRLFERQGDHPVALTGSSDGLGLRSVFAAEARRVRDQIPEAVVPRELIARVNSWLADLRADQR